MEHQNLEDFLRNEENKATPKILCPFHRFTKCIECNRMNNQDSILDLENRNIMEKNLTAIQQPNGKFKLLQKMAYYENPLEIYKPENSNKIQAQAAALRLYKKLEFFGATRL